MIAPSSSLFPGLQVFPGMTITPLSSSLLGGSVIAGNRYGGKVQ